MRPDALWPATAKAAAKATGKLKTRLSKGEKRNRKRVAEVGAVYDLTPFPRTRATSSDATPTPSGRCHRRRATSGSPRAWSTTQPPSDICADYLLAKRDYLHYPQALAAGWPIATGIIEGACRHLVKDRLDLTGARWDSKVHKPS